MCPKGRRAPKLFDYMYSYSPLESNDLQGCHRAGAEVKEKKGAKAFLL